MKKQENGTSALGNVCSWLVGMSVALLESEKMPIHHSSQNYKHIVVIPKARKHCVLVNILVVTKTEKCYSVYNY